MAHLISWHLIKCGCYPDKNPDFTYVCDRHFYNERLIDACLESEKQLDKKIMEALALSFGQKKASAPDAR